MISFVLTKHKGVATTTTEGKIKRLKHLLHKRPDVITAFEASRLIHVTVNASQPTTVEQSYINAENFLQMQGAKIITKTVENYAQRLSKDEASNVEALAK